MSMQDFLPYLNIVLMVCLAIGGFFAWKKGYSQESGAIQESVIVALKEEVAAVRRKVDDLEKERATQDRVIATIRYVLKQYNLRVTIQGDVVTINDNVGKSKSMRVQEQAIVKPIMPSGDDDDAV
jgi:hypothetical protein